MVQAGFAWRQAQSLVRAFSGYINLFFRLSRLICNTVYQINEALGAWKEMFCEPDDVNYYNQVFHSTQLCYI